MSSSAGPGFAVAALVVSPFVLLACTSEAPIAPPAAPSASEPPQAHAEPAQPHAEPAVAVPAAAPRTDVLAFLEGATVRSRSSEADYTKSAFLLIDQSTNTGWETKRGEFTDETVVIEMPNRTTLDGLSFDMANASAGWGATKVGVEVSDTTADGPWQTIATVALEEGVDGQSFEVKGAPPARYVRLTATNERPGPPHQRVGIVEARATGTVIDEIPRRSFSGAYTTSRGTFHIREDGGVLVGCYTRTEGVFDGAVSGRIGFISVREGGDAPAEAAMVLSNEGKRLDVMVWRGGRAGDARAEYWSGERSSDEPGDCPGWVHAPPDPMEAKLSTDKRLALYVQFDFDSDVIKRESLPILDDAVRVLKAHPEWKITIEGHTDSVGGDAYNQPLSERRAASVVRSLIAAGVPEAGLTSTGLGASRPLASNAEELGRARNRRVEVARE